MVRIIAALVMVGMAILAIKIAIFVAIIVGLIRWPKETIGVVAMLFMTTMAGRYPIAVGIPFGILMVVGIYRAINKPPDDPNTPA